MMAQKVWTCQRTSKKVKCRHVNPRRKLLCEKCGKRRPATKKPAHMRALNLSYEDYIKLNGGEFCGICKRTPPEVKLCRDHDHITGKPRGLACINCNRRMAYWMTEAWLIDALSYIQRKL